MRPLTKVADETECLDENLNAESSANGAAPRRQLGHPDPSPPPGSGRSPSERACLIAVRLGLVKGAAASAARSG